MKKLIPALALLVVSAILMGTSTFAWFSLNSKVNVTGMTVTTKIGDSLQIAGDTLGSTAKKAESNFSNGLYQPVYGLLEPVSTTNGTNFWYTSTTNVKADGNAIADEYVAYNRTTNEGKNAFDKNYSFAYDDDDEDCMGYVDYVFQIKATNTADSATALKMTSVNLIYNDATLAGDNLTKIKAYRVAIFVEDITSSDPAGGVGELKTILSQADSAYFNTVTYNVKNDAVGTTSGSDGLFEYIDGDLYGNNADPTAATKWYTTNSLSTAADVTPYVTVTTEATAKTTGKQMAVNGTSTLGTVSNFNTAATLANVTENSTEYFKVVVRMWLEGEDTTCNNETYLELDGVWTLDLAIELGGATDPAGHITAATAAIGATAATNVATLTVTTGNLTNGQAVASYQWYNATTGEAIVGATAQTYTNADTVNKVKVFCVATAKDGRVYRSQTVELDKAPTP